MPRKPTKVRRTRPPTARRIALGSGAVALVLAALYAGHLWWAVAKEFELRHWDRPAQVYAAPVELYAGRRISQEQLVAELRRLGYRQTHASLAAGTFRSTGTRLEVVTRRFEHSGSSQEPQHYTVSFAGGRIAALAAADGSPLALARLDPLLIGSLFTAHGEDRLILREEEIPPLLTAALKVVEDRRFDRHSGIDFRGILRAAWVNLRHGEIRQGASTLTQQLVRSYYLSNERSWSRKLREAWMAAVLELRYTKEELLHAYVNEVYLAQDGARAVHGFGLGSQFYFGKPLRELELHELALLVGQVRGPAYYDPRRHPERALERRDLVLRQMAERGLVSTAQSDAAAAHALGVLPPAGRTATYHAAFLDLVRRQLARDYAREDLVRAGLRVYTTLEPAVQGAAEEALVEGLRGIEAGRAAGDAQLDGAVVVTRPQTGEVLALVGGRRVGFQGFNRALDARRPVGSLIKPVVYLAALETGDYSLASVIDDTPIEVTLDNGTTWSPSNFDDQPHGSVPLLRALAESLNLATVRLGLAVGVERVTDLLARLGLDRAPPAYPSLLLGALELAPFETAQIYTSLASGGFRAPLRAVDSVVDAEGGVLQRYPLRISAASSPELVQQLNHALVQVMERGTGRSVRARLPADLVVAGKTGTSDGYRDSWFAGFTNEYAVVTWVGADDNRTTGLTGASGAATVWARLVAGLGSSPYSAPASSALSSVWIDYETGGYVEPHCVAAAPVMLPVDAAPRRVRGCEPQAEGQPGFGNRIRRWLRSTAN